LKEIVSIPADFCYPPGLISVDQALDFILQRARTVASTQRVELKEAGGRVLREALRSPLDVPGYDNSQMDGYAIRTEDMHSESVCFPVSQYIPAGRPGFELEPGTVARIFTGAVIPEGADAVIMQENCERQGDSVTCKGPITPGMNIRLRGNDIRSGDQVLQAGDRLTAPAVGLAASLGIKGLLVSRRLRVAIFSSGDELKEPGQTLGPGEIYNSNRYTMTGLLAALDCECIDLGQVADTLEATEAALLQASSIADVVISSGGVSVGEEDHIKAALERIGKLEMWKVAVKPGKPLAYGRIGSADFLGLPGNPVSTLVTFCLFVRPFLLKRMGAVKLLPKRQPVRAGFDWPTAQNRREYPRARISDNPGDFCVAELHPRQSSEVLSSTVWAEGVVEIPEGCQIKPGQILNYISFSELFN
jgi:molybdopterin molybdotransferase